MDIGEGGLALQPLDLVLLEQELDALRQALDRVAAAAVHRVEVKLDVAGLDPPLGQRPVRRFLEQLGGVQQRFRRNAADVEASAAEGLAAFRARGLEAELRSADRRDIAAGAGTDHKNVE